MSDANEIKAGGAYLELGLRDDPVDGQLQAIGNKIASMSRAVTAQFSGIGGALTGPLDMALGKLESVEHSVMSRADFLEERQRKRALLGDIIGPEAKESAKAFYAALSDINVAVKSLYISIASTLAPVIRPLADGFLNVARNTATWISNNRELIQSLAKLVVVIGAVGTSLKYVGIVVGIANAQTIALVAALVGVGFVAGLIQEKVSGSEGLGFTKVFESIKVTGLDLSQWFDLTVKSWGSVFNVFFAGAKQGWAVFKFAIIDVLREVDQAFRKTLHGLTEQINIMIWGLAEVERKLPGGGKLNISTIPYAPLNNPSLDAAKNDASVQAAKEMGNFNQALARSVETLLHVTADYGSKMKEHADKGGSVFEIDKAKFGAAIKNLIKNISDASFDYLKGLFPSGPGGGAPAGPGKTSYTAFGTFSGWTSLATMGGGGVQDRQLAVQQQMLAELKRNTEVTREGGGAP